jgi:tetratricopeptide (TPR) repeat protein
VPELMFQRISDILGALPAELYAPFGVARPNGVHLALAAASNRGASIATTNYDLAIEAALGPDERAPLHLHGSVADIATIVHTIRAIGRGLPADVGAAFTAMLDGRRVTIVGYSGNDREVMEALVAARPSSVTWLVRSPDDPAFPNIERIRPTLNALTVETCDLEALARAWTGRYASRITALGWRASGAANADGCAINVPPLKQLEIVLAVFLQLQDYRGAAIAAKMETAIEGSAEDRASIVALHAFAARRAGRLADAIELAGTAARLASDAQGNVRARALTEVGLANLELDPPDVAAAEPALYEAYDVLATATTQEGNEITTSLLASAEQNLGFLEESRGEYVEALARYRRALDMKRRGGDLAYEITSARDVALMLMVLGRDGEAGPYLARFRDLAAQYSDYYELANFDLELGRYRLLQRRWADAERLLSAAEDGFARINAHAALGRAATLLAEVRRRPANEAGREA